MLFVESRGKVRRRASVRLRPVTFHRARWRGQSLQLPRVMYGLAHTGSKPVPSSRAQGERFKTVGSSYSHTLSDVKTNVAVARGLTRIQLAST